MNGHEFDKPRNYDPKVGDLKYLWEVWVSHMKDTY